MKKLIRNQYIDFATISSIEVSNADLADLLDLPLMSKSIKLERLTLKSIFSTADIIIKQDITKTKPLIFTNKSSINKLKKINQNENYILYARIENEEKQLLYYNIKEIKDSWEKEKQEIINFWKNSKSYFLAKNEV